MADIAVFSVPLVTVTGEGATEIANAIVPAPSVTAHGLVGVLGEVDISVPKASVTARAYHVVGGAISVPLPTVTAKAAYKVSIEVPMAEVTATGKVSVIGKLAASVPNVAVTGKTGFTASIEVPLTDITAHALVGTLGKADFSAPAPDITAHSPNSLIGRGSFTVPKPTVTGQSSRNQRATASITVPMVQISPRGYAGVLGKASITVPCVEVDGTGYFDAHGTASITVPLAEVLGNAATVTIIITANGESESVTGYALVANIENSALSEYSNFGFNSFAKFNGVYLGASSTGIYQLTGDKDNTSRIVAKFRTSLSDGESSLLKGVEDLFIGLSSDGVLEATIYTDGNKSYQGSAIPPRETDEIVTQRVKLGKGIKSRYYAVEVQNRAGADFDIESAELTVIPLARKM